MKVVSNTEKGNRKINEDYIIVDEINKVFILADGIGGCNAGEVASELSCKKLYDLIKQENYKFFDEKDAIDIFKKTDVYINDISLKNIEYNKMGTTLVLLQYDEEKIRVTYVGDSRVYGISIDENVIIQLTTDHTLGQELIRQGIDIDDEIYEENKNKLIDCIGYKKGVKPEVIEEETNRFDYLVICSDGLHDYIDMNFVKDTLFQENIEIANEIIMSKALDLSYDNISFIIIKLND